MFINRSFRALMLLLLLSLSSSLVHAQHKTNDLISDTCMKTPNYALCVSTLRSDPRSPTADVAGLGFIVVEAVKAQSTAGLKIINDISSSSPILKGRLAACSESYNNILNDFVPEAEQGPPKFGVDGMKATADVTQKCVQDFQGLQAPLPATNQLVHDLSVVAAAIISTLL